MDASKVKNLIDEAIAENESLYLVDWSISTGNQIQVLIDGDKGLSIDEVVRISRHIDQNLDREEEDFSLTVSSPGLDRPLSMPRQYQKNIGRLLKVKTKSGEIKGEIIAATNDSVTLQWKQREPKPVGKGKHTVQKEEEIPYSEIEKATIHLDI
ncbi:MAG: ribosome assembly cofactor RimP [Weeksellaceae bacterium]